MTRGHAPLFPKILFLQGRDFLGNTLCVLRTYVIQVVMLLLLDAMDKRLPTNCSVLGGTPGSEQHLLLIN